MKPTKLQPLLIFTGSYFTSGELQLPFWQVVPVGQVPQLEVLAIRVHLLLMHFDVALQEASVDVTERHIPPEQINEAKYSDCLFLLMANALPPCVHPQQSALTEIHSLSVVHE